MVIHVDRIAPELGKTTMNFSGFGTPVDVPVPLPSQTVPMPVSFSRALGIV